MQNGIFSTWDSKRAASYAHYICWTMGGEIAAKVAASAKLRYRAEMLNDDELVRIAQAPESELIERKPSASDRSAIRRTICAFANDLAAHESSAVILVGLMDDGRCADLNVTDRLLQQLASMRDDGNILPIPSMEIEQRQIEGCCIVVIHVHPSTDPPVRYQGRVWVRIGNTSRQATPEEEQRLAERRRAHQLPFDHRPADDATPDDLDLEFFRKQYLLAAVAEDVRARNQRPVSQQLESLRLLRSGTPTFGAILVMGRDPLRWVPGAFVSFLRIAGHALTDPVKDTKELSGPLHEVVRWLDELLELNLSVAAEFAAGTREVRRADYPIGALRQYARNALIHRSYEGTHAPVRVYWFDDRVEIQSPGGLFGRVTAENFGKGATDYRNPLVAEAMAVLGYVQRFGVGVPLAERELAENGNPAAEYSFQPTVIGVTIRRRP